MATKSLSQVLKGIEKEYGKGIAKIGADSLESGGVLSLGSPMADYAMYGGILEGRITELSGPEGSGKTTTSFLIAKAYCKRELERHPVGEEWEFRGETHAGPRKIIFLDNEGTLDPNWAKVFGYDLSEDADVQTIVIRPEAQSAEEIFDMALDLLKTGEVGLLIFDSIATLVPQQIADASMEQQQMGGIAKALTRFANTAIGILRKYNATLIGLNQVRDNMSGYGNPITTVGGRGWRHACSARLMFRRGDFVDEDGNKLTTSAESPAGHIVNVIVLKTKTSRWDRKLGSYRLNYTRGVDVLADTVEAATHLGLIDNSTQGYYKIIDPSTGEIKHDSKGKEINIHGKKNVSTYFEEHLDEWKALYDLVYEKITEKESPFSDAFNKMLESTIRDDKVAEILKCAEDGEE